MNVAEYSMMDATALAAAVRDGEVTPAELRSLALDAIARINPTINAVIETLDDPDPVEPGVAFAGVPFLIKDLGATRVGVSSELGSRMGEGMVGEVDGEIIRRLRVAGMRLVGRSTVPEFALHTTTESRRYGATCNPWNIGYIAGGSSGGAAAAVAAGMVPIAHGNDGSGSIRIPAACCGAIGLKPTRGRVSDAPFGSRMFGWAGEFAVTRSVRDTAALLDTLSGSVPGDPFRIPSPEFAYASVFDRDLLPLRVVLCTDPWSGAAADATVTEAVLAAGRCMEAAGCVVDRGGPTFDWESFALAEFNIFSVMHAAFLDSLSVSTGRPVSIDTVESHSLRVYQLGKLGAVDALMVGMDAGDRVCRQIGQYFSDIDILITPTMPVLPARLGTFDGGLDDSVEDIQRLWARHDTFTAPFNLTGQPAISVPCAISPDGLPIGVQLVANFGREDLLLQVAHLLFDAARWVDRVPAVHASRPLTVT